MNLYFQVRGCVDNGHTEVPIEIWIVDRQSRARKELAPPGLWGGGSLSAHPARGGLVLNSHAGSEAGGVYFVHDQKVDRLVPGWPASYVKVSPNGCKVAASVRGPGNEKARQPARLVMVDICSKKGE